MSEENTDIRLIEAARDEMKSCDAIVARYGQTMFGIIARLVDDRRDAEELTQDALLKAFRKIDTYDPGRASLRTWLCCIAYRTALSHLRRPLNHTTTSIDNATLSDTSLVDSFMQCHDDGRVEQLMGALEHLSDEERMIVNLFYYEDMPLADIAYIMSTTPNALAVRLHRIRSKLYNMIENKS